MASNFQFCVILCFRFLHIIFIYSVSDNVYVENNLFYQSVAEEVKMALVCQHGLSSNCGGCGSDYENSSTAS